MTVGRGLKCSVKPWLPGQEEGIRNSTPFYTTSVSEGLLHPGMNPAWSHWNSICWGEARGLTAAICFGDQTPALGDEDEGAQSVFFSPHGDCQGGKFLSPLPIVAFPPTPIHLHGFPVTWPSTVTNWYRVNNLCGKDPKPPRATCMAGAGCVYLLRCVWLLRITEYN